MEPTLEELVAAFAARQREKNKAAAEKQQKEDQIRSEQIADVRCAAEQLREEIIRIFKLSANLGNVEPVKMHSTGAAQGDIIFTRGPIPRMVPSSREHRICVYISSGKTWYSTNYPGVSDTYDKTEFLVQWCEVAGKSAANAEPR